MKAWGMKGMAALCVIMLAASGCGKSEPATKAAASNAGATPNAAASAPAAQPKQLQNVKVVLDWTPNTNHTGLYVAKQLGYYEQEGLNVDIVQPGQSGADTMVATGEAQFGVGYQEGLTQARVQDVPLVSIGAIIQHNTSGFASPAAKNIKSPKDFEGKTYGGWGSPSENAMIESLMQQEHADASKVKIVNIGEADYFTAVKKDIDFAWIYYGWTGVEAELRGEPINMIYLTKYSDKLDYYTPLLETSEKMIKENPELVKKFMAATSKGYEYAIGKPDKAADILIKAVPDLDPKLVKASQKWLSPKYQDDAPRWGEQKQVIFENYANWMYDHKLLDKKLDASKAFTNDFLPAKK
ncbi:ABC transporter substrate-binding protein [Gordoniibacillus kamchatkensis]|uniref:ABC transporter substrate-binding protein n=1 Tax=Gordoniibacillus kamchatkensis TaxID=1590651 RepID=A0ABR5AGA9_9BACL|nr:ABC transporter substrate-binding protein [Paenibacillus sp. VKM B-2647]KIL39922.1 ABC transporter substrate-binding protein [Paenibacillus sp. VKM B-2647]